MAAQQEDADAKPARPPGTRRLDPAPQSRRAGAARSATAAPTRARSWSRRRSTCSAGSASRARARARSPRRRSANLAAIVYHFGGKEGLHSRSPSTSRRASRGRIGPDARRGRRAGAQRRRRRRRAPPCTAHRDLHRRDPRRGGSRTLGAVHRPRADAADRRLRRDLPLSRRRRGHGDAAASRRRWQTGRARRVRLRVFTMMGQVLVFRVAQALVLRRMDWTAIGDDRAGADQAHRARPDRRHPRRGEEAGANHDPTFVAAALLPLALAGCIGSGDEPLQGYVEGTYVYVSAESGGRMVERPARGRAARRRRRRPLRPRRCRPEGSGGRRRGAAGAGARRNSPTSRPASAPRKSPSSPPTLSAARTTLAIADDDYHRKLVLREKGVVAQSVVDDAKAKRDSARGAGRRGRAPAAGRQAPGAAGGNRRGASGTSRHRKRRWRRRGSQLERRHDPGAGGRRWSRRPSTSRANWSPPASRWSRSCPTPTARSASSCPSRGSPASRPARRSRVGCDGCPDGLDGRGRRSSRPTAEFTPPIIYSHGQPREARLPRRGEAARRQRPRSRSASRSTSRLGASVMSGEPIIDDQGADQAVQRQDGGRPCRSRR